MSAMSVNTSSMQQAAQFERMSQNSASVAAPRTDRDGDRDGSKMAVEPEPKSGMNRPLPAPTATMGTQINLLA